MKVYFTAIASGSNGNCYYVGNENEAVLVDVGISCREIEQRMKRLELSISKVKAIFISHEHTDHVRGAHALAKKYKLPIYITPATLQNAKLEVSNPLNVKLIPMVPVQVGELEVTAFPKWHDARDPHSFVIRYKGLCVGVFTDIGAPCENVIRHFKCCNAIFLEANYDDQMLEDGPYSYFLKSRVASDKGHLSNRQALDLFVKHKPPFMSHIFLSHISQDNNDLNLVNNLFKSRAGDVKVILTSRMQETPVYSLECDPNFTEVDVQKSEKPNDKIIGTGKQMEISL